MAFGRASPSWTRSQRVINQRRADTQHQQGDKQGGPELEWQRLEQGEIRHTLLRATIDACRAYALSLRAAGISHGSPTVISGAPPPRPFQPTKPKRQRTVRPTQQTAAVLEPQET